MVWMFFGNDGLLWEGGWGSSWAVAAASLLFLTTQHLLIITGFGDITFSFRECEGVRECVNGTFEIQLKQTTFATYPRASALTNLKLKLPEGIFCELKNKIKREATTSPSPLVYVLCCFCSLSSAWHIRCCLDPASAWYFFCVLLCFYNSTDELSSTISHPLPPPRSCTHAV